MVGEGASGEINVSVEENGGSIAEGFIQGGGETFAARLALRSRETDGYVYNAFLDEDEGAIDEFGGPLTLVWEPSESFSSNFKYTYMERVRDGANSATWRYLSPAERNAQVPNRSAFANTAYSIMDVFFPDFPRSPVKISRLIKTTTTVKAKMTALALDFVRTAAKMKSKICR